MLEPALLAGRRISELQNRVDPRINHHRVAALFLFGATQHPTRHIGVKVADQIASLPVLFTGRFDLRFKMCPEVPRKHIRSRAFALAFSPTCQRSGFERCNVVNLILIQFRIDRRVNVFTKRVEAQVATDFDLSIDPSGGGIASRVEVTVSIDQVAAVVLQRVIFVVRSQPQMRFDVVDANADKLFAVRVDEPPDAR